MEPVIRSVVKHGNQRWEIDFGLDEFGKRRRPVFETEDEAKDDLAKWQKNVKKAGDYWANLEPTKRLAIVATLRAMDERNVSVSKVWEDWLQAQQQGINKQITPTPYDEAVIGWKDVKLEAGKDETYVYQAGRDLMKFAAGREKRHIHLFLTAELEAYFKGHTDWGLSSKKTYMSLFHSLWEVAERKGWVYNNIVDKLEPITRPGQIVRIYPNSIAKSLMAVMRAQADCTPDSSSYVCVGYLAGVAARDSGKSTCDKYRIIKVKAIELDLFGLLFEKLPSTILLERDKERQAELTKVRVEISEYNETITRLGRLFADGIETPDLQKDMDKAMEARRLLRNKESELLKAADVETGLDDAWHNVLLLLNEHSASNTSEAELDALIGAGARLRIQLTDNELRKKLIAPLEQLISAIEVAVEGDQKTYRAQLRGGGFTEWRDISELNAELIEANFEAGYKRGSKKSKAHE